MIGTKNRIPHKKTAINVQQPRFMNQIKNSKQRIVSKMASEELVAKPTFITSSDTISEKTRNSTDCDSSEEEKKEVTKDFGLDIVLKLVESKYEESEKPKETRIFTTE